jgi:ABC-type uncharacterized transport system permease subunit
MTTTDVSIEIVKVRATPEERRARVLGGVYILLALAVLILFANDIDDGARSTFDLATARERFPDVAWTFDPKLVAYIVAAIMLFLAGWQLTRGFGEKTNVVLGGAMLLFTLSFLGWAAADNSFSMVGMLTSMVVLSVPITLGGLTGTMCERVAVINIGIEGQLLTGAFVGALAGSLFDRWTGLALAIISGGVMGAVLAVLVIKYHVDQIIAGVVITIFATGFTSFLADRVLGTNPDYNSPERFTTISIPLLEDIPLLGSMFFRQNIFLYITFALVVIMHLGLFHTRWGLRSRAVGEHPKAADTVGINVFRTRYINVILGGMIAGFGGAALTLGATGRFEEEMTAGVGYIGLAAMIFGRWRPFGVLGAALVFGFSRGLQQKLGILGTPIPSEFLQMLPYVVTIIVVAGLVGKSRPPAADGQPYIKQ